jgi:hypothetical protein
MSEVSDPNQTLMKSGVRYKPPREQWPAWLKLAWRLTTRRNKAAAEFHARLRKWMCRRGYIETFPLPPEQ